MKDNSYTDCNGVAVAEEVNKREKSLTKLRAVQQLVLKHAKDLKNTDTKKAEQLERAMNGWAGSISTTSQAVVRCAS